MSGHLTRWCCRNNFPLRGWLATFSGGFKNDDASYRDLKRLNFPVGRLLRAKTFRTKCVNCFRDMCAKSAYIDMFLRHVPKWVNYFRDISQYTASPFHVWKLSRLSENFPDCPETFQTVRKLSTQSFNFPDCLETFQTDWKLSRLSETFQTVRQLSRLPRNFPDCLKPC